MAGFNFEKNLPHQQTAVNSVLNLFNDIAATKTPNFLSSNPLISFAGNQFYTNLINVQKENGINKIFDKDDEYKNVLDISMETGTGKTYTYTKTIFELNKQLKQFKFIIVVPTLSIKAGTISFLTSKATRDHFRQDYNREISLYVVESKKGTKNRKDYIPQAIREFVENSDPASKNINILIINQGMINSDTMSKTYDTTLFNQDFYQTPFKLLESTNPILIIDEPHKFKKDSISWANIKKINAQWIIRYGATFDEGEKNLLYKLSAVDAFNQDLVKGVVTFVEEFSDNESAVVRLKSADSKEAIFEVKENGQSKLVPIAKSESMIKVHEAMTDLHIDYLKSNFAVLSNGLEVTTTTTINPYSYSQSIQDKMIEKAVAKHFELERELLTHQERIKPLTLFFIDDIEGYRDGNNIAGSLKTKFEKVVKGHIEKLLQTETDTFYKSYLEMSLKGISSTHGGYFSKDNNENSEEIEKEINEILHDKESLLSLDNPRRFIFSKWTLREGWDNPNVFQICKLRSSGSITSKLQEVGRGLRLPVNEFMSRVKNRQFYLNYFVDFTEKDFAQSLVDEINSKSGFSEQKDFVELSDELVKLISDCYQIDKEEILVKLDDLNAINRANVLQAGGMDIIKKTYPEAFSRMDFGVKNNKIRNSDAAKQKTTIRAGKYNELKELWELINQKAFLEYKVDEESVFCKLFSDYLEDNLNNFEQQGIVTREEHIKIENNVAHYKKVDSIDNKILPISYMKYNEFLIELATAIKMNINSLHSVFYKLRDKLDINLYLNMHTIRMIRSGFNKHLLDNSMQNLSIGYNKISNNIYVHPTAITDKDGKPVEHIDSSSIGIYNGNSDEKPAGNYLFNELFFDSQLEKENIITEIEEVVVFTKIPKNSIRIPVAGGGTYSPDFAYIVKNKDGNKTLNLVIETKDKDARSLDPDEKKKIEHAEKFFKDIKKDIVVKFQPQFRSQSIKDILQKLEN